MPSQSRATRESQKKLYDKRLQERQAVLEKKGMTPKEFKKDKLYEHLKAKQRAIMRAIAAIDNSDACYERNKVKAVEQAAPAPAPKEKKPKKEKPEKAEKTEKAAPSKAGE